MEAGYREAMIPTRHAFDGHWLTVSQIATTPYGERFVRRAIKAGISTFAELEARYTANRRNVRDSVTVQASLRRNRKAAWNPHKAARLKPGDVFDDGRVYGGA